MKAPNPFSPNGVVSHSLFAGRGQQVSRVIKKLSQVREGTPSSFFFMGERGIGKTALARLIRWIAQSRDEELQKLHFSTAYYSVVKGQKTQDVLQAILNETTDEMSATTVATLATHLGNLFKNGKFAIGAFGFSMEASVQLPESEVAIRDQVVAILSNIIGAVHQEGKDGLLLIIDEVNNLEDLKECAQLIRGVVTTLNVKEKGNLAFILIGYRDTAKSFFLGDPSSRRHFDEIPLEAMPIHEVTEVLKKGFESANVTWDEDALNSRALLAGGYPHAIQVLGHNVYEVDSDGHIGDDDWSKAIFETAEQLQSKEFAGMYNFHNKKGVREQVLDILIKNGNGITRSELQKKCPDKNVYRTVSKLKVEGSIIEDDNEKIEISSQLLRLAIILSQFVRKD